MIDIGKLKGIYKRYGFEYVNTGTEGIIAFTIRSGYFHNADIIQLDANCDTNKVFSDFKRTGYACTVRNYSDIEDVERSLFNGFFTVESTKKNLLREYKRFTETVLSVYSDNATYNYIKSEYFINDKKGELDVISEITSRMEIQKPVLFLIEAAAGYGKTCTAYELLNALIENGTNKIPLFSELHKNRQAKIFRYVLLDEIDRSFPTLSSSLVNSEITNGNVPVLLDGFDELLSSRDDREGYENTEPMLETIGGLLKKRAKVVLTTRRTAVFDGDEFHEWIDSHIEDFDVIRIRLSEPTVQQWLESDRYNQLLSENFPIEKLSNPVLLSYLRCISENDFDDIIKNKDKIVEKYFSAMLERERTRQDLLMKPSDQYEILKTIAKDMMSNNYTSSNREEIIELIEINHTDLIGRIRLEYPSDSRPTNDEIINKLASHALLDRSNDFTEQIGFVNEFVLGDFCAKIIIEDPSNEWVGDSRFIEPSVLAYIPRNRDESSQLLNSLQFCLEFESPTKKLESTLTLLSEINYEIEGQTIEGIKLESLNFVKDNKVSNSIFINCVFINSTFFLDSLENVSFMNCEFYGCQISGKISFEMLNFLGCSDDSGFIDKLTEKKAEISSSENQICTEGEKYILSKYFPVGRDVAHKHRAIKGLCVKNSHFSHKEILIAIDGLKKKEFLINPDKVSFLELNIEKIASIKIILGRV